MYTLNAETAPAYPEVAASGECRSNPTNQQTREVDSMMSHPGAKALPLERVSSLVRHAISELDAVLSELSADAPVFQVVDADAALQHVRQALALIRAAELIGRADRQAVAR